MDKPPPPETASVVSPESAAKLPRPPENLATPILARHGVEIEYYAPRGTDNQRPHKRDEIYIVARGSGIFLSGGDRKRYSAGDTIFVPARSEHRFVDFSDDFATWVIFFGPDQP